MHKKTAIAISVLAVLVFAATALTSTTAHHDPRIDERIVHPYNQQVMTHVPIVAGYEPLPPPQHCTIGAQQLVSVYDESFDGDHGYEFISTPLAATGNNLWHVTDHPGGGSDGDRAGENRLYFGQSTGWGAGTYNAWPHPAGVAQSPPIELPLQPSFLNFATKWEVEYLVGYDHLWVEMLDEDGNIHLLCTANSMGRADEAGVNGNSEYQSCSPFHQNPCPTYADPELSSEFPAWEHRSIQIPPTLYGQEVRLRFTFDASDGAANWFTGWQVDDVTLGLPV